MDLLIVRISTIVLSSWSARKIAKEFGTSLYFTTKSKQLKYNFVISTETSAKHEKHLPQATVNNVIEFYKNDINSKLIPGMNDTILVKVNSEGISI